MEHDSREGGVRVKQEARTEFPVIPILKLNNIDIQWSFNDMVSATTATTKTA